MGLEKPGHVWWFGPLCACSLGGEPSSVELNPPPEHTDTIDTTPRDTPPPTDTTVETPLGDTPVVNGPENCPEWMTNISFSTWAMEVVPIVDGGPLYTGLIGPIVLDVAANGVPPAYPPPVVTGSMKLLRASDGAPLSAWVMPPEHPFSLWPWAPGQPARFLGINVGAFLLANYAFEPACEDAIFQADLFYDGGCHFVRSWHVHLRNADFEERGCNIMYRDRPITTEETDVP